MAWAKGKYKKQFGCRQLNRHWAFVASHPCATDSLLGFATDILLLIAGKLCACRNHDLGKF